MAYEYKVIPAPTRGARARGVTAVAERHALAVAEVLNAQGVQGWDFMRTETLSTQTRKGMFGKTSITHELMIFRRSRADLTATPGLTADRNVPDAAPRLAAPAADRS